jgi:hypothetical protein
MTSMAEVIASSGQPFLSFPFLSPPREDYIVSRVEKLDTFEIVACNVMSMGVLLIAL